MENEQYQSVGPCACMGPLGNDPHCPCVMRQKGLEPTNIWTPEVIAELQEALRELVWEDRRYRNPPCMECGAHTAEEGETMCICAGDKDHCHGCDLWPD